MNHILELAERLAQTHDLPDDELLVLIRRRNPGASSFLKAEARALCDRIYGKEIYLQKRLLLLRHPQKQPAG